MSKILVNSKLQRLAAQKKDAYVTRSVSLPMIDEKTLIERAAENSLIHPGHLYAAMQAVTQTFRNFLFTGHSVQFPNVGVFRFGINAHASEQMEDGGVAQVYRLKILYRPTSDLRQALNSIQLEKLQSDIIDDTNEDNQPTGGDENNG